MVVRKASRPAPSKEIEGWLVRLALTAWKAKNSLRYARKNRYGRAKYYSSTFSSQVPRRVWRKLSALTKVDFAREPRS